ncbi:dihydropteroate synthase [Cesiribacter andamanensis]|uniref:dihydropteroate synthase n=1 Tax=Cesiribacter andamanensis AMV16 TaxID=1279009 RepID=M7N7D4_9BACT|nr:dihydropteroate synthase [Cesiribacter andamanensis]EMR04523.1 Dihydropteroate synthase [Cesiribacter andamanensis AMV16]
MTNYTLNLRGKLLDLSQPRVMGIINVTPDSFYAGSRLGSETELLRQAERMLAEGADLLDVGGYSTRPGAADVLPEEEQERVCRAIGSLVRTFPEAHISVDTFRAGVAAAAVAEGACLINDIGGGELDADMFTTVARLQVPYILMHMRGTPQTMAGLNQYEDLLKEIIDYFAERLNKLRALGVKDIIADPGFGFAKNIDQNYLLLQNLRLLTVLNVPLLVGISRKSLIWKKLGITPEEAGNGSTVLNTLALTEGAHILRVHDVKQAVEAVRLWKSFRNNSKKAAFDTGF